MPRLRSWLSAKGWTPWAFQEETWSAYDRGESGLLNVPTGAGKTYAAYFAPLADAADHPTDGLQVLFVTPLRAVSRDIEAALRLPVDELGLPMEVASRTGDTSASVRARQKKRLPHVMVTTPESLTLLLTQEAAREQFAHLRAVIVDEWHELLSSKRGTQTELALARLRSWRPGLRTWALSATLANIDQAARAAVGVGAVPTVVRGRIERPITIESLIPSDIRRFPWAGHLGLVMLDGLLAWLDLDQSTLIFTNTRSQAERWFQAIQQARPEWDAAGKIALHHGSIEREDRERIEAGLKGGGIRLVVCTSSLDLGVDFAPVERVVQIGSPKGVSRLIQRAGRSGHRPGAPCRILCVPTHALELVEIAAVRRAIEEGDVEPRLPLDRPLDVLVQHLVTCALGGGFVADELYEEVRRTAAFESLSREEFEWSLDLVRRGGETLKAYPGYHRVVEVDGRWRAPDRRLAQLHRMNVGTITGDSTVQIRYERGRSLGRIEESFVTRMRAGERFFFAGKMVEFVRMHEMVALVKPARGRTNHTPIWSGTRLPISESMSEAVRRALERARDGDGSGGDGGEPELAAAGPIVQVQARLSRVPGAGEVLAEECTTRDGHHLFLYPFEGRLVHAGLAALLALRCTRVRSATFSISVNDYGLELLTPPAEPFPFEAALTPGIFTDEGLAADAVESVNLGALAKQQFREIARVSGLVFQTCPGAHKSARQLHSSASLIYDVFEQFDPGNLLLAQARREVLERQFERSRLGRTLRRLRESPLRLVRIARPTPLSLPLIVERIGAQLSSETLHDRIERMRRHWAMEDGACS